MIADENLCPSLVDSLLRTISKDTLYTFVRTYLLEAAHANIRWSLHTLLYSVYRHSSATHQELVFEVLSQLWPDAMTAYGAKAGQYVDLLGYVVLKLAASASPTAYENARCKEFLQRLVDLFQAQNLLLATHPNSTVYNSLAGLVGELEGVYLEPEPCFICNNVETPVVNLKLSAVKADSRYTTNQQIFKLNGTYSLNKLLVKITEIRKAKMVAAIDVYYTNKTAHSIVDLKMNSRLWSKAKRVSALSYSLCSRNRSVLDKARIL